VSPSVKRRVNPSRASPLGCGGREILTAIASLLPRVRVTVSQRWGMGFGGSGKV
jgi:hypothetical protein